MALHNIEKHVKFIVQYVFHRDVFIFLLPMAQTFKINTMYHLDNFHVPLMVCIPLLGNHYFRAQCVMQNDERLNTRYLVKFRYCIHLNFSDLVFPLW